ncbi:hypothetical protein [Curtobacterium sp. DN_7.5]|uniref:hypothetical protein n=1 Tax=Curtobacterium sp. DN_7.5 TaxID=3049047 RepID=UPI001F58C885|nr:hypothetical protein [Curtobacterium sp. DN_7.5]
MTSDRRPADDDARARDDARADDDAHADDDARDDAELEPRWVRRTPILPEQWWAPPAGLAVAALAVLAIGVWLRRAALPLAIVVCVVGLVGAVVLAVAGRHAYWSPSRAAAWRLHRTRVVAWSSAGVALVVFGLAIGAQVVLIGLVVAGTMVHTLRRDDPTRFELRGRAVASVAVAVASAVLAIVALTVPGIDDRSAARWSGWGLLVVPAAAVVALVSWRAAGRRDDDPLSAPDRTAS